MELSNYEQWQLENKGDILPEPNIEIEEPGEDGAIRFAEWTHAQHEQLLHEYDDQYTNSRY